MKKFNIKREKRKLWLKQHRSSIIKYGSVAICSFLLAIAIMYYTKADFSTRVTFDVIDARVAPFSSGDVVFAYNVDGQSVSSLKDNGLPYAYISSSCTNDVTYTVTNGDWHHGYIDNLYSNTKCTIYLYKVNITYYLEGVEQQSMPDNTHYFNNVVCDNGVELTFDRDTWKYLVTNVNQTGTSCNVYFQDTYSVTINFNGGGTSSSDTIRVALNASNTVTITSDSGYLYSGECSNGYTITNMSTGESTLNVSQEITITNNGNEGPSTCTFTSAYPVSGSNDWTGYYTCDKSTNTATMRSCQYSTGTFCNGGSNGETVTYMCTLSSSSTTLAGYCNSSLSGNSRYGGGMSNTISC